MPWAKIVEEIRNGREKGSELLYAAVCDCARPHLFQRIHPELVDDHIQEIALIVLTAVRRGELRDPSCLMGFVRTVTRRQVAVHIRREMRRRRRLISVECADTPAVPSGQWPDARIAERERVAAVRQVLGRLRPRDRDILMRFYVEEQEPQAICREMKLTATQFRLFKSRALAKCVEFGHRLLSARQSTKPLRIA